MPKPQPFLNYMPWHVKQKIADEVDAATKLSLRLCSKEYKKYVDSAKTIYEKLEFKMSCNPGETDSISVHLTPSPGARGPKLQFLPESDGYWKANDVAMWGKAVEDEGDYIEGALLQLLKIMNNPKCVVENFELVPPNVTFARGRAEVERINEIKEEVLRRLDEHLIRLNRKLKVRKLSIRLGGLQDDLEKVLPHLEPGTLREITVSRSPGRFTPRGLVLDRIAETEQWKQAEMILISSYEINLPLSEWSHFQSTTIRLGTISLEELEVIIETMKQSSKWEECRLHCDFNVEEFQQYIQQFPMIPQNHSEFFHYAEHILATLNSGKTLSINIVPHHISICKSRAFEID